MFLIKLRWSVEGDYSLLSFLFSHFADSSPIRRQPSAAETASADSPKLRVRTMASGESISRTTAVTLATTTASTTYTTAPFEPNVVSRHLVITVMFLVLKIRFSSYDLVHFSIPNDSTL